MENIVELLVSSLILIFTLVLLVGNSRRRKSQQRNVGEEPAEPARPEQENEGEPPPFMEDFPFATQLEEIMGQQEEEETEATPVGADTPEPPAVEEPNPPVETPQPPPIPVDSPTQTRAVPATSLLELSPQTFRQGIILAEILGRPKTRRKRRG